MESPVISLENIAMKRPPSRFKIQNIKNVKLVPKVLNRGSVERDVAIITT